MRTKASMWAARQRTGGPETKLLLLALANRFMRGAPRFYSGRALAEICEISLENLATGLHKLQRAGFLRWSDCPDDDDGIEVTLLIPEFADCDRQATGSIAA